MALSVDIWTLSYQEPDASLVMGRFVRIDGGPVGYSTLGDVLFLPFLRLFSVDQLGGGHSGALHHLWSTADGIDSMASRCAVLCGGRSERHGGLAERHGGLDQHTAICLFFPFRAEADRDCDVLSGVGSLGQVCQGAEADMAHPVVGFDSLPLGNPSFSPSYREIWINITRNTKKFY